MSNWKSKSKENIDSANFLLSKSLYSSVVHCAYYSNIQSMIHVIYNDLGFSEEQIEIEYKKNIKKGFHNWLNSEIVKNLVIRNYTILMDFNNYFVRIKQLRINSDYKNINITPGNAKQSIEYACFINIILKENFKV